jgi:cell division protein FtsL
MLKPIALVAVLILVSALMVIEMRHRNRQLFAELQALQTARDQLTIEWDQLLLEQGAWSEHRRVENLARTRLGMAAPRTDQIVILRAPGARRE